MVEELEVDVRVASVEAGRVAKGVEVVELFVGGLAVEEPAVFKRHLKYLQLGVVMGVAGACCSVSNGLIPFMGAKVPG